METSDFHKLADTCLERVATWLESFDADEVDFSTPDGVVTIEFADGAKYVLNRQTAADQMWFAAGARAWHYVWDTARSEWRCDKDDHELYARIAESLGQKLGREVTFG